MGMRGESGFMLGMRNLGVSIGFKFVRFLLAPMMTFIRSICMANHIFHANICFGFSTISLVSI